MPWPILWFVILLLTIPVTVDAQDPLSASDLLARARDDIRQLLLDERPGEAKRRLEILQLEHPADPRLSILLGEAHYALEDMEAAIASFRKGIDKAPNFGGKIFNLGRALQQLGRDEEATAAFEVMAREKDPGLRSRGLFGLGLSQLALGDENAAFDSFKLSLSVDATTHRSRYRLALILLARGDEEEAIGELERVISAQPLHHGAIYNLALALGRAGRDEESRRELQRYRTVLEGKQLLTSLTERWRENTDQYDLMVRIGVTHRDLGSYSAAGRWFEKATRAEPTRGEAGLEYARTLVAVGELDGAERTLRALLDHPDGAITAEARKILDALRAHRTSAPEDEEG